MTRYAQTNLQLFNQLHAAGYAETDLAILVRAYAFAMEIFPACFRPTGKPLLAHLVGTASILADLGAPAETVAAGLLHAAYPLGDFGDGGLGPSNAKRRRVCAAVGDGVETLVSRYEQLGWRPDQIRDLRPRFADLETVEREVVLMRVANELEDHLDLGGLYVGDRHVLHDRLAPTLELAEALGQPVLAQRLAECGREEELAGLPAVLQHGWDRSVVVAPLSYRLRFSAAVRRMISQRSRKRAKARRKAARAARH